MEAQEENMSGLFALNMSLGAWLAVVRGGGRLFFGVVFWMG